MVTRCLEKWELIFNPHVDKKNGGKNIISLSILGYLIYTILFHCVISTFDI